MRVDLTGPPDHHNGQHCMFCAVGLTRRAIGSSKFHEAASVNDGQSWPPKLKPCTNRGMVMIPHYAPHDAVTGCTCPSCRDIRLCSCANTHLPPASALAASENADWMQPAAGVALNPNATLIMGGAPDPSADPSAAAAVGEVAASYLEINYSATEQVKYKIVLHEETPPHSVFVHDKATCPFCSMKPSSYFQIPPTAFQEFEGGAGWMDKWKSLVTGSVPGDPPPYVLGFDPSKASSVGSKWSNYSLPEIIELFVSTGGKIKYEPPPAPWLDGIFVVDDEKVTAAVLEDYLKAKINTALQNVSDQFNWTKIAAKLAGKKKK